MINYSYYLRLYALKNVLNNEDIVINGDGSPLRSYMYPTDLMIWLWTILFKGNENQPYNVGSDKPISIYELARLITRIHGSKKINIRIKEATKGLTSNIYIPSISKAESDLNLRITISIEDSVKKFLDFANYSFLKGQKI